MRPTTPMKRDYTEYSLTPLPPSRSRSSKEFQRPRRGLLKRPDGSSALPRDKTTTFKSKLPTLIPQWIQHESGKAHITRRVQQKLVLPPLRISDDSKHILSKIPKKINPSNAKSGNIIESRLLIPTPPSRSKSTKEFQRPTRELLKKSDGSSVLRRDKTTTFKSKLPTLIPQWIQHESGKAHITRRVQQKLVLPPLRKSDDSKHILSKIPKKINPSNAKSGHITESRLLIPTPPSRSKSTKEFQRPRRGLLKKPDGASTLPRDKTTISKSKLPTLIPQWKQHESGKAHITSSVQQKLVLSLVHENGDSKDILCKIPQRINPRNAKSGHIIESRLPIHTPPSRSKSNPELQRPRRELLKKPDGASTLPRDKTTISKSKLPTLIPQWKQHESGKAHITSNVQQKLVLPLVHENGDSKDILCKIPQRINPRNAKSEHITESRLPIPTPPSRSKSNPELQRPRRELLKKPDGASTLPRDKTTISKSKLPTLIPQWKQHESGKAHITSSVQQKLVLSLVHENGDSKDILCKIPQRINPRNAKSGHITESRLLIPTPPSRSKSNPELQRPRRGLLKKPNGSSALSRDKVGDSKHILSKIPKGINPNSAKSTHNTVSRSKSLHITVSKSKIPRLTSTKNSINTQQFNIFPRVRYLPKMPCIPKPERVFHRRVTNKIQHGEKIRSLIPVSKWTYGESSIERRQ